VRCRRFVPALAWALATVLAPAARTAPAPADDDSLAVTPAEPPDDAPGEGDVVAPRDGTVADGDVEVAMGADGDGDRLVRPRRRVRFRDGALGGDLRSGSADPLAGGALEVPFVHGTIAFGRVSPRWGRGLVVGAPADPWRDARASTVAPAPRTRSLDGARWRAGAGLRAEVAGGSMAHERVVLARAGAGAWDFGVLSRARGAPIVSLGGQAGGGAFELGMSRYGAWRAEGTRGGRVGGIGWTMRGRAGSERYSPPGAAAGRDPAQASALELDGRGIVAWRAMGSLWRHRSGVAGARAALEVERELTQHDHVALGTEEQHGARRDGSTRPPGMRQAGWVEWRGGRGPVRLGLRDEIWGHRGFARDAVRAVSTVRLVFEADAMTTLAITRSAYHVAYGEDLYLPEAGTDRWWLRAVSGDGTHTRIEFTAPLAGGRLHASLTRIEDIGRSPRPHWSFDWTRRSRTTRDPARAGP